MQKSISQESVQDPRYKTIVSEQRTRHPTTVKKNQNSPSEFKRTYYEPPFIQKIKNGNIFRKKSQSLRESLSLLQSRKQRYIQEQKYKKAKEINRSINRTKSLLTQAELNKIKYQQVRENKSIKSAYKYEIHYFQKAWSLYLEKSKEKEEKHINRFELQRSRVIDKSRSVLARKCVTLNKKSAEIIALQKQEQYYKKKGDLQQLSIIKGEKKRIKEKLRKERQSLIMKWTKDEQVAVNRQNAKRYEAMINRIQEQRKDQQRAYIQQKSRLKQKFKNVMSQLKHQQKMILNFANMRIDQIKIK